MQFWTLFGFSVSTGGQIKTVLNSPWTVVWIGEIVYASKHSPTQYIPSFRLVQTKVFGFGSLGVYDVRSYISSVNLICVSLCVSVCVHLYVAGSKFLT